MGARAYRLAWVTALLVIIASLCACGPQRRSPTPPSNQSTGVSTDTVATQASVAANETTEAAPREDADWETVSSYLRSLPEGRDVKAGDSERKAILDAVRVVVERDLGQQVRFVVDHLQAGGGFAAFRGRPVRPDGGKINYLKTRYRAAVEAEAFDDQVIALLQERDGRWTVLECDIGDTDWPGSNWLYEYEVPFDLFAWE